jgi:hypothetical protein
VIAAPRRQEKGMATSADGTRIAWYRYGGGERSVLFLPTWNLVDARVVGHQVAALESDATVLRTTREGRAPATGPSADTTFGSMRPMPWRFSTRPASGTSRSLRLREESMRQCC